MEVYTIQVGNTVRLHFLYAIVLGSMFSFVSQCINLKLVLNLSQCSNLELAECLTHLMSLTLTRRVSQNRDMRDPYP